MLTTGDVATHGLIIKEIEENIPDISSQVVFFILISINEL